MYVQLFFWNDFTNDDFSSKLFTDNVSKRYVLIFQKRRYVQKIFSMIFKCFKIYVQRNIFNDFFQCLKSIFKKVYAKFFSLIFQRHLKIFLLFTQKVFDIESGVYCKTEFIGCYSFLTNLIKLKHMPTKITTSFLFRDTTLIYAWNLRRRVSE